VRAPLALEMRAAATALERVRAGAALPPALAEATAQWHIAAASRPATHDIAYTAVRLLGRCQALASRLNSRAPAPPVAALQMVALSVLLVPGHRHEAVLVDQAVAAARLDPATRAAAPFLNATLRRFLREREALLAAVLREPEARWNHPSWWIDQLRADHPQAWEAVLEAGNAPPPMTLRVNVRRVAVQVCLERLRAEGIGAQRIGPQALRLDAPCDVRQLPGFAEGHLSVQDLAAQLAAPLLDVAPGQRVLDACAAPGGKTAHLLELADCALTAIDADAGRLARVSENLARLGLAARVLPADAARPADWWDGRPFDRILVDAPCSASGIVRRHPEIRWLRRRRDLATLSARQSQMLSALWPLLAPGGKLLFATCSVFRAEGEQVAAGFCEAHPEAQRLALRWRWPDDGRESAIGQLLPGASELPDHDGFFFASLRKRP
jgi:16S rRNA (cytosine967-C5)-methyltransferase